MAILEFLFPHHPKKYAPEYTKGTRSTWEGINIMHSFKN